MKSQMNLTFMDISSDDEETERNLVNNFDNGELPSALSQSSDSDVEEISLSPKIKNLNTQFKFSDADSDFDDLQEISTENEKKNMNMDMDMNMETDMKLILPKNKKKPKKVGIKFDLFDLDEEISPKTEKKDMKMEMNNRLVTIYSDSEDEEFQSAIMYSLSTFEREKDTKLKGVVTACTLSPLPYFSTFGRRLELGSTSSLPTCVICHDVLPDCYVRIPLCKHLSCEGCMERYIVEQVKFDIREVACPVPKCCTVLRANFIYQWLPNEVCERWMLAKKEASVLHLTCYLVCPLEGCRKQIVDDEKGFKIRACTRCWRLFCYNCRVGWHMGMTCWSFMRREEEARKRLMLMIKRREVEESEKERIREEDEARRKSIQKIKDMEVRILNSGYSSDLLPIFNLVSSNIDEYID